MPKGEIELRRGLGNRTFEAAVKLLDKDAIVEKVRLSDTAYYARVKDAGTKVVLLRDRDGVIDATCDCSKKPMGCKHCAAVYLDHIGFVRGFDSSEVLRDIDELARTSFDPRDYEIDGYTAVYEFYNYIQDKVLNRRIRSLCRAIARSGADEETKEELYRRVWEATENLESPHDEWSQDVFYGITGLWFGEDEDQGRCGDITDGTSG